MEHQINPELMGHPEQHHQMLEHHPEINHHIGDPNGDHVHQVAMGNWPQNDAHEGIKRVVLDLQRHWLDDYTRQREKLHEEFLADEEKIRAELVAQFKDELDTTKEELEKKYRETLKNEIAVLEERHKKEMNSIKRQQWCWQCEKEAIYPCCWNTAYCCVECQQAHWPSHKKYCRRKKGGTGAAPVNLPRP